MAVPGLGLVLRSAADHYGKCDVPYFPRALKYFDDKKIAARAIP
jgi:hypothetical protein